MRKENFASFSYNAATSNYFPNYNDFLQYTDLLYYIYDEQNIG